MDSGEGNYYTLPKDSLRARYCVNCGRYKNKHYIYTLSPRSLQSDRKYSWVSVSSFWKCTPSAWGRRWSSCGSWSGTAANQQPGQPSRLSTNFLQDQWCEGWYVSGGRQIQKHTMKTTSSVLAVTDELYILLKWMAKTHSAVWMEAWCLPNGATIIWLMIIQQQNHLLHIKLFGQTINSTWAALQNNVYLIPPVERRFRSGVLPPAPYK